MTQYLLLISLGPVQDFIAAARRCQDLWYGSWLLSELSRVTAQTVSEGKDATALIFPASLGDPDTRPAVANKIMLVTETPKEDAEKGRAAMQAHLKGLAERTFENISHKYFNKDLALMQLDELMEFLWVAVEIDKDEREARKIAEKALAARKNTRTWGPVPWHKLVGDRVPKSSLDGVRESVINELAYSNSEEKHLYSRYRVRGHERLCGIGLMKRNGTDPNLNWEELPAFHSTSHTAAAPLLVAFRNKQKILQDYLDELKDANVDLSRYRIKQGREKDAYVTDNASTSDSKQPVARTFLGLDGTLFFEDRLHEICDEQKDVSEERLRKSLRKCLAKLGVSTPCPYYVFLRADGDKMGKAIDAQDDIESLRRLGEALNRFSSECRGIVELSGGSLIYAGGDDVVALIPLHTALRCANELREAFYRHLHSGEISYKEDKPTLSVGLAIAHHLASLHAVRKQAEHAEHLAKGSGRNALAVVLSLRSGPTLEAFGSWEEQEGNRPPLHQRLEIWRNALEKDLIPSKLAYELETTAAPFEVAGKTLEPPELRTVLLPLARRALHRRRGGHGTQAITEAQLKPLEALLTAKLAGEKPLEALKALSAELQIAALIQEAHRCAKDNTPKKEAP